MKHSIRGKFALLLFLSTFVLSLLLIIISNQVARNLIDDLYKERTDDVARSAAAVLEPEEVRALRDEVLKIYQGIEHPVTSESWGSPEFEEYVGKYISIYAHPAYRSTVDKLRRIQDVNHVNCIYIYYVDVDNSRFIYLADADAEEPCPIGCIDAYEWGVEQANFLKAHPEEGYSAYITETQEYGWLVSSIMPIFSDTGEVLAYTCTDISMDTIIGAQNQTTTLLIILALVSVILVDVIGAHIVNKSIIIPLVRLSNTAENYWTGNENRLKDDFSKLDIRSDDEIGVLADSMKKMETDINNYFITLDATRQELTTVREESAEMKKLANRDSLTGIRNKTAYDAELQTLERDFAEGRLASYGIAMVDLNYLKRINDTYGHDKGNVAIKKVCKITCDVFCHSPVFRIGGDEFVVVLKGGDLEHINALIGNFRATVDKEHSDTSQEYWERVSAAIGYAVYDPALDSDAESVFKRADAEMYKDKQAQKAGRT